jgi:hypothetical protein
METIVTAFARCSMAFMLDEAQAFSLDTVVSALDNTHLDATDRRNAFLGDRAGLNVKVEGTAQSNGHPDLASILDIYLACHQWLTSGCSPNVRPIGPAARCSFGKSVVRHGTRGHAGDAVKDS